MNYRTVDLNISKEDALLEVITKEDALLEVIKGVNGVRVGELNSEIEFISPSGYHIASLAEKTLPDGIPGAQLRYRVSVFPLWGTSARQKAGQIRTMLDSHRYSEPLSA